MPDMEMADASIAAPAAPFKITKPGIYDAVPDDVYHRDPVEPISVSAGVLKSLITESAVHARLRHPKLNPAFEIERSGTFDKGHAVHKLVLEKIDDVVVIDADDWRKDATKAARDRAYNANKTPLLRKDYEAALDMAKAARAQLDLHHDARGAFTKGKPEQTMVWGEEPLPGIKIWCRARLDWLPEDGPVFDDYKSTGASAAASEWGQRTLFDMGAHIQHALYRRGISKLLRVNNPTFRFIVQENFQPHALSVIELAPAAIEIADDLVERGLRYWAWCLSNNRWPGYPGRTAYVDMPIWLQKEHQDRQTTYALQQDQGIDPYTFGVEFWKP